MEVSLIIALITAGFSFITAVVLGLLQLRLQKSQAKKTDVEAYTELIKTANAKTEADLAILRGINEQLNNYVNTLQARITVLEREKLEQAIACKKKEDDLLAIITELEARLENCERKLKGG